MLQLIQQKRGHAPTLDPDQICTHCDPGARKSGIKEHETVALYDSPALDILQISLIGFSVGMFFPLTNPNTYRSCDVLFHINHHIYVNETQNQKKIIPIPITKKLSHL